MPKLFDAHKENALILDLIRAINAMDLDQAQNAVRKAPEILIQSSPCCKQPLLISMWASFDDLNKIATHTKDFFIHDFLKFIKTSFKIDLDTSGQNNISLIHIMAERGYASTVRYLIIEAGVDFEAPMYFKKIIILHYN